MAAMEKWVQEGLVFSFVVFIIFTLISLWLASMSYDSAAYGFPFPVYVVAGWKNYEKTMPLNLVFDIAIILVIGFGISYLKNKILVKK